MKLNLMKRLVDVVNGDEAKSADTLITDDKKFPIERDCESL